MDSEAKAKPSRGSADFSQSVNRMFDRVAARYDLASGKVTML